MSFRHQKVGAEDNPIVTADHVAVLNAVAKHQPTTYLELARLMRKPAHYVNHVCADLQWSQTIGKRDGRHMVLRPLPEIGEPLTRRAVVAS